MYIREKVDLRAHSTMHLGGIARYAVDIDSKATLSESVAWAASHNLPTIMIGGGSNTVWLDEGFEGLLLVNKMMGYELKKLDDTTAILSLGAGEKWDDAVGRSVNDHLSGLESLSSIPGNVGGAPVQNIGAYGTEQDSRFESLEAYDQQAKDFVSLGKDECQFSYRRSRFNGEDRHRFFVLKVTYRLHDFSSDGQLAVKQPFYKDVQQWVEKNKINSPTPADIRKAVIEIRKYKLPNPEVIPNNGSFFRNPIISQDQLAAIVSKHPKLAEWPSAWHWDSPDGSVKLAAGALLDYLGFKDYYDPETGMSTWKNQALVLVNKNAHTTKDLLRFRQKILDAVQDKFGITLEQEPELLP